MNLSQWVKKTIQVMIIPADRPVLRLRLPQGILLAAGGLLLSVFLFTIVLYALTDRYMDKANRLTAELEQRTTDYKETVNRQTDTIQELERHIDELSAQGQLIQDKMAELQQLEAELRQIAPIDAAVPGPGAGGAVRISGAADGDPADPAAVVGSGSTGLAAGAGGEEWIGPGTRPVSDGALDRAEDSADWEQMRLAAETLIDNLTEIRGRLAIEAEKLRVTPTLWPTESTRVTSRFGYRRDPFTRVSRFHAGVDIAGATGDPVYAAADGRVEQAGWDAQRGYHIVLQHGSGLATGYMHLNKLAVEAGNRVQKGQTIGNLGSTGRSTGPHLHYEVWLQGNPIDPWPYMQGPTKGG